MFKIITFPIKIILKFFNFIFGLLFGWVPRLKQNMSGEEFEEYVQMILKRNGYKNVQLTKRSGDYGVDILAKKRKETYAFQCKCYNKPVGVAAVQQAYAGCDYYGCDKAVVVTNNTFTKQAKILSCNNDVLLIDGKQLSKMRRHANSFALFRKKEKQTSQIIQYQEVLELFLSEGFASADLLVNQFSYSERNAIALLDYLSEEGYISSRDDYNICDLYFTSMDDIS